MHPARVLNLETKFAVNDVDGKKLVRASHLFILSHSFVGKTPKTMIAKTTDLRAGMINRLPGKTPDEIGYPQILDIDNKNTTVLSLSGDTLKVLIEVAEPLVAGTRRIFLTYHYDSTVRPLPASGMTPSQRNPRNSRVDGQVIRTNSEGAEDPIDDETGA